MKILYKILFLFLSFNLTYAQSPTCETASAMCSGQGGPYNNSNTATPGGNLNGIGNITNCNPNPLNQFPNLVTTPYPAWFYYTIGQSGPIVLNLVQTDTNGDPIDVDFALWGPFNTTNLATICNSLSGVVGSTFSGPCNLVDSSYSGTANETIHIPNAISGEIYLLLVTNFSRDPGTYSINQTNTTEPGAGQISCDRVCGIDLGPDRRFCTSSVNSLELVATYIQAPTTAGTQTFTWSFFDGTNWVPRATTSINRYTVNESGFWRVSVTRPGCFDATQDDIEVRFATRPTVNSPSNMNAPAGACSHTFDLTQNQAALTAPVAPSNYVIKYYTDENDCLAGNSNFITNPSSYTVTTTTTIYVRVENLGYSTCADATKFFDLVIDCLIPPCQLDLTSASSTTNQTVCINIAIQDITYSFGGEATGVTVSGLPTGLTTNINAGVLTISGTPSQSGVFNYTVETIGCTSNLTIGGTITINALPNVTSITSNPSICSGSNAIFTINGTPEAMVSYSINAGTTVNETLSNTGSLIVTVSNVTSNQQITISSVEYNGCSRTMTLSESITITQPVVATFNSMANLCIGSTPPSLPLTSIQNFTGTWSPSSIDTSTVGTYSFSFSPVAGQCASSGSLQVVVEPRITPTFNAVPELCLNSSNNNLPIQSIQGISGTWNPSTINTTQLGIFTYTFTPDASECASSTTIEVTIKSCAIPKGVSPNGDGLNDTWDLSGYNVKKVEIFNRYGTKVYSKTNYIDEWHGQSDNSNELPDGTYYYVVEFNDTPVKTGWVYINREQ